jgi:hypothetical protein
LPTQLGSFVGGTDASASDTAGALDPLPPPSPALLPHAPKENTMINANIAHKKDRFFFITDPPVSESLDY